jgi:hypothetical protein
MINLPFERQQLLKKQGLLFNTNGSYISPDNKTIYCGIPKNASSFIGQLLQYNGWNLFINEEDTLITTNTDISISEVTNCFVVLRDPYERWVSSITQYLVTFGFSTPSHKDTHAITDMFVPPVMGIITDLVDVDDHTLPQHYYFSNLHNAVDKTYFWVNKNLKNNIISFYNLADNNKTALPVNDEGKPDDSIIIRNILKTKILRHLDHNPSIKQQIINYYKKDYDIIGSVDIIY